MWSGEHPEDRGSAPVEFILVGALLTGLVLAVLQLGFVVYVRNIVHDAAVEGAHRAALADANPEEGGAHTRLAVARAVGDGVVDEVRVLRTLALGVPTVEVRVRTTLPVIGLLGVPAGMELSGRAPAESFGDG